MVVEKSKEKLIAEALDLLLKLEHAMLELEKDISQLDQIESVMRYLHSLKGIYAMFDYKNINDNLHQLEEIFDNVQINKIKLTGDVFETTYTAIDLYKRQMLDTDLTEEELEKPYNELFEKIINILNTSELTKYVTSEITQSHYQSGQNLATWYVVIRPDHSFFVRGINLLKIFQDIKKLGHYKILRHDFSHLSNNDKKDSKANAFVLCTGESLTKIEEALMFILDDCNIVKIADFDIFNEPEFEEKITHFENEIKFKHIEGTTAKKNSKYDSNTGAAGNKQTPDASELLIRNEQIHRISKQITSRITVDSEKLDYLMFLVSELVTTKAELSLAAEADSKDALYNAIEKIDKLSKQFRDNALNIRLVPISEMVVKFKRLIRDLSISLKKDVDFIVQGEETELDKNIIDMLAEPIMHIIRNALDHGVESAEKRLLKNKPAKGIVKLVAYNAGSNVFIQIQDDGNGIDPTIVRNKAIEKGFIKPDVVLTDKECYGLIFLPGFSTAENVTTVSGRGVGMDVVRHKINEMRGEIIVDSEVGLGTIFTIKLQQTISIIDTLHVKSGASHFCIPLGDIKECTETSTDVMQNVESNKFIYGDQLLPFISLNHAFDLYDSRPEYEKIVVINKNEKKFAIGVDTIIGEYQAVIKPLSALFSEHKFLSGGCILGDGNLAFILDTEQLLQIALIKKTDEQIVKKEEDNFEYY